MNVFGEDDQNRCMHILKKMIEQIACMTYILCIVEHNVCMLWMGESKMKRASNAHSQMKHISSNVIENKAALT